MSTRRAVPRRAVSRPIVKATPAIRDEYSLNMRISSDYLQTYLVKLAILHYRTEPRFRTPENLSSDMASLSVKTPVQSRRVSYTAGLTLTHSSTFSQSSNGLDHIQSSKSKLPKDVVDLLKARLEEVVFYKKHNYNLDELSKRIWGRFLSALNGPVTADAIKRSRSPLELLMFFLKEASMEIKSYNEKTQTPGPIDPSIYIPNFVKLLVDMLRTKGYGSTYASLINELESFKKASSKGQTLRPTNQHTGVSGSHTFDASHSGLGGERNAVKPSYILSDMAIAKHIALLFGLSEDQMQRTIQTLKEDATEMAAVAELKYIRDELEINNRHPTYSRGDFSSESAYLAWKKVELVSINHHISHFLKNNSSLATVLPSQPAAGATPSYTYMPPDPKSFYRVLVEVCLKQEAKDQSDLILSKDSLDLMQKVTQAWRLTNTTRGLIFLHVSASFYEQEKFSIEKLSTDAIDLAYVQITDNQREPINKENWADCDKDISYGFMKSLHTLMVDKMVLLLQGIFNKSRPNIKPYMNFLAQNADLYSEFEGYPELDPTPHQLMAIKEVVIGAAEDFYGELVSTLPQDHTLCAAHVVQLADELNKSSRTLKKRYPGKLLGTKISNLALKSNYRAFADDSFALVKHLISMQTQNGLMTIKELAALYGALDEAREFHMLEVRQPFPFDLEGLIEPFVSAELQAAFDRPVTWVDPAIGEDSFLLRGEEGDKREIFYSSSVGDIFSSFNDAIALVNSLQWQNEIHVATFYTIAMKVSLTDNILDMSLTRCF